MKKLLLIFALLVSACVPTREIESPFDPAEAMIIRQQGKATISGQAFLRRNDGMVVYAAGSTVTLIPKTKYTMERMFLIYGGAKLTRYQPNFKNTPAEYYAYMKQTKADGEGKFTFESIAPGAYYIVVPVTWNVGGIQQGGSLMEEIAVSGTDTEINTIMTGQ
nr:carboxypeptidase regulatory-like domain-containing protein [uncultured Cohaesibacter sp.]